MQTEGEKEKNMKDKRKKFKKEKKKSSIKIQERGDVFPPSNGKKFSPWSLH